MLSKIKRLAAFSLALVVCVSLASCEDELSRFKSALKNDTERCTVTTSLASSLGTLTAEYTVEYTPDMIAVEYEKDSFGTLDESSSEDDLIIRTHGTAVIDKDGAVDGELGALVLSVILRNLNLDNENINYTIDNDVLSFTVLSNDCEGVIGVDLGYDARVEIILFGDSLSEITVNYTAAGGNARLNAKYE